MITAFAFSDRMKPLQSFELALRTWTIGIYFVLIIVNQSEASCLPLVNQISISWGNSGTNLTSSNGGASNLTIAKDDSMADWVDEDHNSSDKLTGINNQSEVEKSRISWFPGGLHELNNQIMSEIADAETEVSEASLIEENDSDAEEIVGDDQVVNKSNLRGKEVNSRIGESRRDLDDGSSDDDDDEENAPADYEKDIESPRNGQRGGALVKEAKKRFLEPLETGKVLSAASRLINDDACQDNNGEQSSLVVPQESPLKVDQHMQAIQGSEVVDDAVESGIGDSLFNIEFDQGVAFLNISTSEMDGMTDVNATSNATMDDSLERQEASHTAFRGIRKRAAKLTHMHGVFSRKYSKGSRGDSNMSNSTIQQEEGAEETLVSDEIKDADERTEISDVASNQTRILVEHKVMENIEDPTNMQGKERLSEPILSVSKRKENVPVNATAADLELVKNVAESRSEGDATIQQEVDRLIELEQNSPTEIGPKLSLYESSGMWRSIDAVLSLGLANRHPFFRTSHYLRGVRKVAAKYTGLHGILSGKNHSVDESTDSESSNEQLGVVRRRLAAIDRARKRIPDGSFGIFGRRNLQNAFDFQMKKSAQEALLQRKKMERVKEIDKLFAEYQQRIMDLVCEKDMLQRRPNPLWNYTSEEESVTIDQNISDSSPISMIASRRFNFPPQDLVDNYLEVLFLSERLVKLNHTDLWRDNDDDDEDEDLSEDFAQMKRQRKNIAGGRTSGNWLLRNGLGQKIGEAAEMAAYKSVCKALMSVLARSISSIHGLNVMKYSDIRLYMEHTPGLPPLLAGMIPGSDPSADYAIRALEGVMFRGAKKNKRKRRFHRRKPDFDFLQRGAIVETLLSHAQISAPLLQLFPLAWQRELLSNIITMATTIISDFTEGLEFHILGHRLSFSFTPITEEDMLRGIASDGFNRKRPDPEQYEAAIRATADDLSNELKFLDKWHERALGSDMLRSQIANLIARLVIHLVDDLLRGARLDLWASHGGPRLVAGLEFRSTDGEVKETVR